MQLFVKLNDGRTRGFVVGRTQPLLAVKEQLAATEGVRVADQRLIWAGRQLDDHATPDGAEMHSGATVHFAMRLRGGLFVETLELVWDLLKTLYGLIRDLWNFLFGKCMGGKCKCKVESEDDESDASSYDDVSESSSDDDDDEAKKARKEERMKRRMAQQSEWGPVWAPPKDPPPIPERASKEDLRVHRSLFNSRDQGKWRIAPFGEHSPMLLNARPVDESRPAEDALSVVGALQAHFSTRVLTLFFAGAFSHFWAPFLLFSGQSKCGAVLPTVESYDDDDEVLVPEAQAVISGRTVSGAHFTPSMELGAYLVETVGIKTGTDVYVERLVANGVDSADKFGALGVQALGAEPYFFKKGHLRQVDAFRGERPPSAPGAVGEEV